MGNRSKEESREALLDASVDVFLEGLSAEESLWSAMGSVTFAEVAARAGYRGPGIAYYVWDVPGDRRASRRAFEADLLERIIEIGVLNTGVEVPASIGSVTGEHALLAISDAVAQGTWDATVESKTWRFKELLMFLRNVETVQAAYADAEAGALDEIVAMVEFAAEVLGLRFRAGLTAQQFAMSTRSLMTGLLATSDLLPDYAETTDLRIDGVDLPVSLFGFCLYAICDAMTEPIDSPPADVTSE